MGSCPLPPDRPDVVLRLSLAVTAALFPSWITSQAVVWAADTVPTDPTAFLPSLGIGGLIASVLFLWLRAEQKRGEKLEGIVEAFVPAINGFTAALNANTRASEEGAAAMKKMNELMTYRWRDRPEGDG